MSNSDKFQNMTDEAIVEVYARQMLTRYPSTIHIREITEEMHKRNIFDVKLRVVAEWTTPEGETKSIPVN